MEPALLLFVLLAVTLAGVALLDVLTGPATWRQKAGRALLVLGLPVIGPVLYFRRIASGGGAALKRGRGDDRRPRPPHAAP